MKYFKWWGVVCVWGFALSYSLGWVLTDIFGLDIMVVVRCNLGLFMLAFSLVGLPLWFLKMHRYFRVSARTLGKRPALKPETHQKICRWWGFAIAWALGMIVELAVFGWFNHFNNMK